METMETERVQYTLPDGSSLDIGPARFRAPEVLFRPDLIGEEYEGLRECLVYSIQKSDMDLRKDCIPLGLEEVFWLHSIHSRKCGYQNENTTKTVIGQFIEKLFKCNKMSIFFGFVRPCSFSLSCFFFYTPAFLKMAKTNF